MEKQMRKYLDLSKLDKDKIEALKSLIGEELFVQRNRSRFKKTESPVKESLMIVTRTGKMFYAPISELPKYISRDTVKKLIAS